MDDGWMEGREGAKGERGGWMMNGWKDGGMDRLRE